MILFLYSRELAGSMKKKHLIIPDVIFDKNILIILKVKKNLHCFDYLKTNISYVVIVQTIMFEIYCIFYNF